MLGGVLILLVRFAVPVSNNIIAEDILDLTSDLNHSAVTEKLGGCSPFANVVLQSVDEFLVGLGTVDIRKERLRAIKELSLSGPGVNSRRVGNDLVGGNRFGTSMDIGCREQSAILFHKIGTSRHACELRSHFKSLLDDVGGQPSKKRTKGLVVRCLGLDITRM